MTRQSESDANVIVNDDDSDYVKAQMMTFNNHLRLFSHFLGEEDLDANIYINATPTYGVSHCDVNNDGLEDFYIGGAAGKAASLYQQNADGNFSKTVNAAFVADKRPEDVGAVFFDADGDGCPDTKESAIHAVLITADVINGSPTNSTQIENAVVKGPFGNNGYINLLEDRDDISSTPFLNQTYSTYALNNEVSACGIAMLTQATQSNRNRWIEITNIHEEDVIPAGGVIVALFNNTTGSQLNRTPNFSISNTNPINPGESVLFRNSNTTVTNTVGPQIVSNGITNYSGANDMIVLSTAPTNLVWEGRLDVIEEIPNVGSKVRIDEVLEPNKDFVESQWVDFVNDGLNPYRDLEEGGPQRHPHDPLVSEVVEADPQANILLGLHRLGSTNRTVDGWDNGVPDRSRLVIVKNSFEESSQPLSARRLRIEGGSKLLVEDQPVFVTNDIEFATVSDEIRLVGDAQLVQSHEGERKA